MYEEKILQQIGLSEKESRVYLACLQLGEASILQLAKKAELKRPHVYNVVESLSALGLLSKTQHQGKTVYLAEEPKKLKELIKKREEKINKILPSLEAFYNVPCLRLRSGGQARGKPLIKIYEGKKAMKNIYQDIYNHPEIDLFGFSPKNFIKTFPNLWKQSLTIFKKHETRIRELMIHGHYELNYAKKYQTANYKIRLIPKDKIFYGNNVIYDNKLAIISLEHLFIIVIESENLYKTFKTLFELAWEKAKEVKNL